MTLEADMVCGPVPKIIVTLEISPEVPLRMKMKIRPKLPMRCGRNVVDTRFNNTELELLIVFRRRSTTISELKSFIENDGACIRRYQLKFQCLTSIASLATILSSKLSHRNL